MISRLSKRGAQLGGEIVQYENSYRLCYIRGTENWDINETNNSKRIKVDNTKPKLH